MDQSLFAAPHGLSQRTTSFIASCHQGIHQMPLSRLIALIINARSAAETLIRKDQIMRDKPNSSAVGAACLAATPGEASGISPLHDVKIEDRKPSPASNCVLYPLREATSTDDCRRNWWSQTGSNRRPQACKASALPTELWPRWQRRSLQTWRISMVGLGRVELPTSRLSGVRSNHLSYRPGVRFVPQCARTCKG